MVELWPDLSFHYGLSIEDLAKAPRNIVRRYADALPRLLAQQTSAAITAAAYPHADKSDQQRILRQLERAGRKRRGADVVKPLKAKTPEEFQQTMAGMGIAVEVVKKDG